MVRHFRRLASYMSLPDVRRRVRADRSWFRQGPTGGETAPRPRLRLISPTSEKREGACVSLVPLGIAATAFGDPHDVPDASEWERVEVDTVQALRPGMFVAQVQGRSMEPGVQNGSYCLFTGACPWYAPGVSTDAKWIIGTVVGAIVAMTGVVVSVMAILIGGVNARIDRLETDVRSMDDRLRAVAIAFGKVDQRLETLERAILPRVTSSPP